MTVPHGKERCAHAGVQPFILQRGRAEGYSGQTNAARGRRLAVLGVRVPARRTQNLLRVQLILWRAERPRGCTTHLRRVFHRRVQLRSTRESVAAVTIELQQLRRQPQGFV